MMFLILEKGAFLNCENLKEINFSNKVKSINDSAFKNCSNLTKIQILIQLKLSAKMYFLIVLT